MRLFVNYFYHKILSLYKLNGNSTAKNSR